MKGRSRSSPPSTKRSHTVRHPRTIQTWPGTNARGTSQGNPPCPSKRYLPSANNCFRWSILGRWPPTPLSRTKINPNRDHRTSSTLRHRNSSSCQRASSTRLSIQDNLANDRKGTHLTSKTSSHNKLRSSQG